LVKKIVYSSFLVLLLMSPGCSVQKNTAITRAYHNLNSHYNIFFNARESYKTGIKKAWRQYKENFNKLLPVFAIENRKYGNMITSEMDRTIKKTSKLITYHSITAKPKEKNNNLTEKGKAFYNKKEYNKWVDDSYLLMGKAQYMKNDYESALTSFRYIVTNYQDQNIKAEALIWAIKTYDQQGNLRGADDMLEALKEEESKIPSSLISEYYAALANHYLMKGKADTAISKLQKALEYNHRKADQARYAFLLGQLLEKQGDQGRAVVYFKKVLRLNTAYDLAFNAHIRLAEDTEYGGNDLKEIKRDLQKLLRDKKNTDYRDQIYYAFGKIALKEGKTDEAIDFFRKSAIYSVSNQVQEGESYLAIAGLYFNRNDYDHAQMYYDSAVAVLPVDFPGYVSFKNKSGSLNRLVRYSGEVVRQDSLQRLAGMSSEERLAVIDEIIEQIKGKEKNEAGQNQTKTYYPGQSLQTDMRYREEMNRSGKWYFFNPTALGFGRTEFRRRWGTRKLEDNWRRKNKSTVSFEVETSLKDTLSTEQVIQIVQKGNKKSRSYYLKQIPLNDSMMAVSHARIQEGLFESALIFKDDLKDYNRAISNLERLINDYPNTRYLLAAYYNLYKLYDLIARKDKSMQYKDMLIHKFPDSEQARILSDPYYLKKLNERRLQEERRYEVTYRYYNEGEYDHVLRECDAALGDNPGDELKSKYLFLRALAIGKTANPRAFKEALSIVTDSAGDRQIVSRARMIIDYLNKQNPVLKQEEIETVARVMYHFNADEDHLMTFFVANNKLDINQLKFEIINFNTDQYPQSDFQVQVNRGIYQDTVVITIGKVGKYKAARAYFNALSAYPGLNNYVHDQAVILCLFSKTNFNAFLKNKSLDTYLTFYKKYYLR